MSNRAAYPEFQNHTQALDLSSKMLFKSFLCIHRLDFSNASSTFGEIDTNRRSNNFLSRQFGIVFL